MADIIGTSGNDVLTGTSGNDTIYGLDGDDTIRGGNGDDVIVGGAGADHLFGDAGNDTFEMSADYDYAAGDSISGGANYDTLVITEQNYAFALSALTISGVERLISNGTYGLTVTAAQIAGFDAVQGNFRLAGSGAAALTGATLGVAGSLTTFVLAQTITGLTYTAATGVTIQIETGNSGVSVTGSASNDVFVGGDGNDTFTGGNGNDAFYAGMGSDVLIGGNGDDEFLYGYNNNDQPDGAAAAGDTVIGGAGFDTLNFNLLSADATLGLMSFSGIERLSAGGFFSLRVTPAELSQFSEIIGSFRIIGTGPLTLGAITLGGIFYLESGIGTLNYSAVNYTEFAVVGSSSAETIVTGHGRNSIQGMGGNDTITGGTGYDDIDGGDGDDTLYGGGGVQHDDLTGNAGVDRLYGGDGDDILRIGLAGDLVAGEIYDGGAGWDYIELSNATVTQTQRPNLTGVTLTGIEELYSSGVVTELSTAQALSVQRLSGQFAFLDNAAVNLAGIDLNGAELTLSNLGQTLSAAGATSFNSLRVYGGSGNDTITGGSFVSYLYGGDGNDALTNNASYLNYLYGDAGNDRLIAIGGGTAHGGTGYDTLVINGATGFSGPFSLSGFEALELTAGTNVAFSGLQFTTGFASNTVVSGSGLVTINLDFETRELYLSTMTIAAGSAITFTVNGTSFDESVKGSLRANNILNGGDGFDFLRGGLLNDVINGGNGNDKITGWTGADTLTGGAGADQFRFFTASDSGFGAARDVITDFTVGTDFLDFRLLDPDPVTPGYQHFSFIGTAAFVNNGTAQLRYFGSGADLLLQVDADGNGVADMEVVLQGLLGQTLTGGNFLL